MPTRALAKPKDLKLPTKVDIKKSSQYIKSMSTAQIFWHLYKRHEMVILYTLLLCTWTAIFIVKLK